jgi:hypothetical protein
VDIKRRAIVSRLDRMGRRILLAAAAFTLAALTPPPVLATVAVVAVVGTVLALTGAVMAGGWS